MAGHMHNVVLDATWWIVVKVKFLLISCDEVTSINNQMWEVVHVYGVQNWRKVLILLFLEKVLERATSISSHIWILKHHKSFGVSLGRKKMMNGLVSFGVDGVSIFQGICINVIACILKRNM